MPFFCCFVHCVCVCAHRSVVYSSFARSLSISGVRWCFFRCHMPLLVLLTHLAIWCSDSDGSSNGIVAQHATTLVVLTTYKYLSINLSWFFCFCSTFIGNAISSPSLYLSLSPSLYVPLFFCTLTVCTFFIVVVVIVVVVLLRCFFSVACPFYTFSSGNLWIFKLYIL